MIKAIFKKLLPTMRMEAGCALSVVAVFLFLEYEGHRLVPQAMAELWLKGEIGQWLFEAALIVVGVVALLLPFVSCALGPSLHRRFGALSLAFSVIVLVCAEGWSAGDALRGFHEGPRIFGVPWNGILGVVALFELAILIYGGVAVLDDPPLLVILIGTRKVEWSLIAINLGVTSLVLFLLPRWIALSPPEAALLALHLMFAITLIRKSPESMERVEHASPTDST